MKGLVESITKKFLRFFIESANGRGEKLMEKKTNTNHTGTNQLHRATCDISKHFDNRFWIDFHNDEVYFARWRFLCLIIHDYSILMIRDREGTNVQSKQASSEREEVNETKKVSDKNQQSRAPSVKDNHHYTNT